MFFFDLEEEAPKGPKLEPHRICGGLGGRPRLKVGTLGTLLALKLTEGIVPNPFNDLPIVVETTR